MQIAVRVPRELNDRFEQTATRKGRHVIELVRRLLRGGLGQPRATSAAAGRKSGQHSRATSGQAHSVELVIQR